MLALQCPPTELTRTDMKKLFLVLNLIGCAASAQNNLKADSLLRVLAVAKEDTNKLNLLFDLSDLYGGSEPAKAKDFIRKAGELNKRLNSPKGFIKYYKHMTRVHAYLFENDSAIVYATKLYDYAREMHDTLNMGIGLLNIGERHSFNSDYEKGLLYSLKGLKLLAGKGYGPKIEGALYGCIQANYLFLKQYRRSVEFGKKAEQIERSLPGQRGLTTTLINLANAYGELGEMQTAENYYNEAITLAQKDNNASLESMAYQGLTALSLKQKNIVKLKAYAEKGLALSEKLGDNFGIMASKQGLSIYYLFEKKYDIASRYAEEALELSRKNKFIESEAVILKSLANIFFAAHDMAKAYDYQERSIKISEAIFSESLARKDAEIRVKYETEKKEAQIGLQAAQLKQKNTLNYILIGSTLSLLLILALSYRNYRNKKILQQRRITELETEKKLTATEAIIKGEEQERSRLAKDLHDGLGGMLSGVKHSLSSIRGNLVMTELNMQAFEHSLVMLDSSISEMRRVAHNMMPESLLKFGLDLALKDFCQQVSTSGILKVSYQSMGIADLHIEQSLAITVYRIVQELLNNSIKHAEAKNAIVQLSLEGRQLMVTVEDDGKGMDTDALKSAKGIGWKNISSRLDYHNGKLDLQSSPGKGTSVNIEFII